ncbi:MAG: hypothetical protein CML66_25990 [Rhodobacteraceae bacterium]|nr:hypothetical protein [Paracoccaceae bacterium]MAY43893.1 hypothetical protein [Paracoccaceae bacterium]|tara:strand:- start:2368 stop:2682 length:315 start_codon:yes stop_codon:yes gene_type:complete
MEQRALFLDQVQILRPEGHQVFFATPLCVGMSAKVAEQTIRALWSAGMLVYVHAVKDNGAALYEDGDDLTEFLASIDALANAQHQKRHRADRLKQNRQGDKEEG